MISKFAALCLVALLALSNAGPLSAAESSGYVIQPGDVLQVAVWKEDGLQSDVLVRPDGILTFPLAGEIEAAGHNVEDIRKVLTERLDKYVPKPVVTVTVKATAGNRFFVLGKVNHPGEFPINGPVDVMQALSLAGGGTTFADLNKIRILRREGDRQVILRFRYGDVARGEKLAQNVLLRSGDTVVVP